MFREPRRGERMLELLTPRRVLQIAPHPDSRSGIAEFASVLRTALGEVGLAVEPLLVNADAGFTWREVRAFSQAAVSAASGRDLVHVSLGGGGLYEFHATRALLRAGGSPVFLTVHDPPWPVWEPFRTRFVRDRGPLRVLGRPLLAPVARRLERRVVHEATGLFTLSRHGIASAARAMTVARSIRCGA